MVAKTVLYLFNPGICLLGGYWISPEMENIFFYFHDLITDDKRYLYKFASKKVGDAAKMKEFLV